MPANTIQNEWNTFREKLIADKMEVPATFAKYMELTFYAGATAVVVLHGEGIQIDEIHRALIKLMR